MALAGTAFVEGAVPDSGGPSKAPGANALDPRVFQLVRAAAHAADCQMAVFYRGDGPDFEVAVDFGAPGAPGVLRFGGVPEPEDEDALAAAAMASIAADGHAL